jgi:hypothetical protein
LYEVPRWLGAYRGFPVGGHVVLDSIFRRHVFIYSHPQSHLGSYT